MEHTMRAAVVTDFHSPLQVKDLPIPEPADGELLVRIETSGLCHTDIHAAHGEWRAKQTPPFIPGHEGVGYVEKLGAGVSNRAIGDRVAIAWLGYACGECRYCNGGWETLCEKQENSGYSVNGTFAEYAVVPAAFASPVPDGISSRDAAPLTCAGVTTYKAIKVARVAPAEPDALFGVGGLGHLALQCRRVAGAFVAAVRRARAHQRPQAGEGHGTRRRPRRQRADRRSGRGHQGSRRRRCGRRPRGVARGIRPGLPVAAPPRA